MYIHITMEVLFYIVRNQLLLIKKYDLLLSMATAIQQEIFAWKLH